MKKLIVIVFTIFISACASGRPFTVMEKPSDNESRIYIYRPFTFVQSGIFPTISIDREEVGKLVNGGYVTYKLASGEHVIGLTGNFFQWSHDDRYFDVNLKAGKTHYFKLDPSMTSKGKGLIHSYSFNEQSETIALEELKDLKESD